MDKSMSRSANTDSALKSAPATFSFMENTMDVLASIPGGKRTGRVRNSKKRVKLLLSSSMPESRISSP